MKHVNLLRAITTFLLIGLVVFSCKKEEVFPDDVEGLSFDSEEVLAKIPAGLKNNENEYAQSCYDFIETALDMTSFIDNMEVPEDAVPSSKKATTGSSAWQWSWHYGGESFTFYWSYEETSSKRFWTMDIQYNNGPRATYIEAWESLDGSQGEVKYNYNWLAVEYGGPLEEDDYIFWKYTWNLDNAGAYNISFYWDNANNEVQYLARYDVVVNADGSGTIDYYSMDMLFYSMTWDVVGNGTWSYFVDGDLYLSGIWDAV